jgi:hypothetical protein
MRSLSLALLALAACPVVATAADSKPIDVNGQSILPWGNLSGSDQVGFHPFASVGLGYDGNVFKLPEPEDVEKDTFTTYQVGAVVDWALTEIDTVGLRGSYRRNVYREYDDEAGLRGGDVRGNYNHEGLTYAGFLTGGWRRSDDPADNAAARELRDLYDAEARGDYRTLDNRYSVGGTWNREYYLNEDDNKDQNAFSGYLRWAYEFAESAEWFVRAAGTRIEYRSNDTYSDSKGAYGVVGYKNMLGSITGISAELGAEYRNYDEVLGANTTATDRTTWSPRAKADATYEYEEASFVKLTGFWELKDSNNSYSADYYGCLLYTSPSPRDH